MNNVVCEITNVRRGENYRVELVDTTENATLGYLIFDIRSKEIITWQISRSEVAIYFRPLLIETALFAKKLGLKALIATCWLDFHEYDIFSGLGFVPLYKHGTIATLRLNVSEFNIARPPRETRLDSDSGQGL